MSSILYELEFSLYSIHDPGPSFYWQVEMALTPTASVSVISELEPIPFHFISSKRESCINFIVQVGGEPQRTCTFSSGELNRTAEMCATKARV